MTRLPQPGKDAGNWGKLLNDFLGVSHYTDGTIRPITFKEQPERTGQLVMEAVDDPNGYVAKNIAFRARGELSRGGPVWFDNNGRLQTWIGWHDKIPSGSSHHGFEVKTASDPSGPAPDVLATRFRLRSDADRTQAAFYSLENLYLDHGAFEPDTKFGVVFDTPQTGDVVSGNSSGRYRLGKVVTAVDAYGAATLDISAGLDNCTAGKIHLFRDANVPNAQFVIYAADDSTTQVFYVDAKTGNTFITGRLQNKLLDGTTLSESRSILDASSNTVVENDVFTTDSTRNASVRFFRNTNTTATKKVRVMKGDGTNTDSVVIDAGASTISALGQDGVTLQPAVLDDDPRLSGGISTMRSSDVSTMDRLFATSNLNLTSGSVYAIRAKVRKAGTFTKIRFATGTTAPSGVTDVRAGVFNATTLVAVSQTANISSSVSGANLVVEAALGTPVTLATGSEIFLGLGFTGTSLQLKGATVPAPMAALAPAMSRTGTYVAGSALGSAGGSATGNILWVELVP